MVKVRLTDGLGRKESGEEVRATVKTLPDMENSTLVRYLPTLLIWPSTSRWSSVPEWVYVIAWLTSPEAVAQAVRSSPVSVIWVTTVSPDTRLVV